MDALAFTIDTTSVAALLAVCVVGRKTLRAFQQSKLAVTESASLINVIVDALSLRIQRLESATATLRADAKATSRRSDGLEGEQNRLRATSETLTHQLEDMLSTDRQLMLALEGVRSRIDKIPQEKQMLEGLPRPENVGTVISETDVLAALTPTERRTLEILMTEGAKGAPELGKRLEKSREHTSRLMKRLYMEGYVSRESNHAPFRYKLNDVIRLALQSADSDLKAEQPERL
jgi:septal ring factor EnvC (AmiA/AmiB activator)